MPKQNIRYYLNLNTGVVHLRAYLPSPVRLGYTQCGRSLNFMDEIKKPTGRTKVVICNRCKQLAGIK